MPRRPALAVFAAFVTGVALSPWASALWPLGVVALAAAARRGARVSSDVALLAAVALLASGHAGTHDPAKLPAGPLLVRGEAHGASTRFPGGEARSLRVGRVTVEAVFPRGAASTRSVEVVATARAARLRVVHVRGGYQEGPSLVGSWRRGLAGILAGPGASRGLLRALLLGTREGLDPELRQAFRDTGCAHLLSISGLHVGVILAWALALGRRARSNWGRRAWVAAALIGYVALVGPRPPILRAAVAGGVFVSWPGRGDPLNRLASAGVAVLLLDPAAMSSLGFFLSFGTVAGLILLARRPRGWRGAAGGLLSVFAASSTTLAVGLGHVPWINLVLAAPCVALLALLLPLGFAGCAGALVFPGLESLCLAPADLLCEALVSIVRGAAGTGAWSWVPLPARGGAALGLGLLFLAGTRRRDGGRWRALALGGAVALAASFAPAPREGLALRLDPRRGAGALVADGRLYTWGDPSPRRVREWRRALGRPWSWTRLRGSAPRIETKLGPVLVVRGLEVPTELPEALHVLVLARRLPNARLRQLLRRTRPRVVWAPASLGPQLGEVPWVVYLPPEGEAHLDLEPP